MAAHYVANAAPPDRSGLRTSVDDLSLVTGYPRCCVSPPIRSRTYSEVLAGIMGKRRLHHLSTTAR